MLPRIGYGPICNKILHEFVEYHKIGNVSYPCSTDTMNDAVMKIFNIILLSFDENTRERIIKESIDFYNDLPPSLR